jgi:hypothetical protein
MNELILPNGQLTTNELEIMKELTRFYSELYKNDAGFEDNQQDALDEILENVQQTVSEEQLNKLGQQPTKAELERIIKILATNKAPGSDGLTIEVIRACWSFIGDDLLKLILHYWETEQLYPEMLQGIIRLLPKKLDKRRIQHWRPLTLLQIVYKIIAKLLAERLNKILPEIISHRQTGFVPGRQILDSISIAYLIQDWALNKKKPMLFLSLDFEKAFDRVDMKYLWETMKKIGLKGKFLALIQGLVSGATAKIHINGLFSEPIPLLRGVRQGDPLAPLLFAVSTQPLLVRLDNALETSTNLGIQVTNNLKICHRLFADDVGVFIPANQSAFNELQSHIQLYEKASGAKLNLEKSIIVPIALQQIPDWLTETRCIIAAEGEVIKYLGAPYGNKLTSQTTQKFCLEKLSKRITTYAPQFLTFTGRVQIVKQVLMSMPTYHLMYLNLPAATHNKINRICKDFIWGYNKEGEQKTPLISWERLCRFKKHGGLAIKDVKTQNLALLARWTTNLFTNKTSEWTRLYKANLELLNWRNKKNNRRYNYSTLDKVLFDNPTSFKKFNYTKTLWNAWLELRPLLEYKVRNAVIPNHWNITDLLKLLPSLKNTSVDHMKRIRYFFSILKVRTVEDLWDKRTNQWKIFTRKINRIRGIPQWAIAALDKCLDEIKTAQTTNNQRSNLIDNWKWKYITSPLGSMNITTKQAYQLLYQTKPDILQLNRWWNVNDCDRIWKKRWQLLWTSDISLRARTFIWRIVSNGLFNNERALKFLHGTGDCKLCSGQKEDNAHIFFNCIFAQYTWNVTSLFYHSTTHLAIYGSTNNLIELLDQSLGHTSKRTTRLLVLYETLFSIWKSRNSHTFKELARDSSPKLIAHPAALHVRALLRSTKGKKKEKRLREAHELLEQVSSFSQVV